VGSVEAARAVALDAAGDVIAVGGIEGTTTAPFRSTSDLAVVKFDGQTGRERWRFLLNGTADDGDGANGVAVDAIGDVIVVGGVREGEWPSAYPVGVALKLAGGDGRLLWRRDETALTLSAVAVDGQGDVVVASGTNPFAEGSFDVIKLAGTTGERVWVGALSRGADDAHYLPQLRVLPSGDLVAAGSRFTYASKAYSWIAARLDGATGAERWRRLLSGSEGWSWGSALAITKNGDIVAGGTMRNVRSCYDATVVRLDAASGDVLHQRAIDGTAMATDCERPECGGSRIPCGPSRKGIDQDRLNALAIHESGRIAIAGVICNGPRGRERGFVAAFSNAVTAPSAAPPAPRSAAASRP
jgi:outer membrane protein assembly factor BamB